MNSKPQIVQTTTTETTKEEAVEDGHGIGSDEDLNAPKSRYDEDYDVPSKRKYTKTNQQQVQNNSYSSRGRKRRELRSDIQPRGQNQQQQQQQIQEDFNIPLQTLVKIIAERLQLYMQSGWKDDKAYEVMGRLIEGSSKFLQCSALRSKEDQTLRFLLMEAAQMIRQNTEQTRILYATSQDTRPQAVREFREITQTLQLQMMNLLSQINDHFSGKQSGLFRAMELTTGAESERIRLEHFCESQNKEAFQELDCLKAKEEETKLEEDMLITEIKKIRRSIADLHKKEKSKTDETIDPTEHSKVLIEAVHARERGIKKALEKSNDDLMNFGYLLSLVQKFSALHFYQVEKLFNLPTGITSSAEQSQTVIPNVSNSATKSGVPTVIFYDPDSLNHGVPEFHCECSKRVINIIELVEELALLPNSALRIQRNIVPVEEKYLNEVHEAEYLEGLKNTIPTNPKESPTVISEGKLKTRKEELIDPENFDTFVTWGSWKAAMKAAGAVCQAIDLVSSGECTNAFCAIRPPGHHAGRKGQTVNAPSQGFCIINNIAIGAKYAVLARGYERVAVVDFDVHHGNGTQDILGGDKHMLFISIHVYDEKKYFFPGTGNVGEGAGNVLNIPLKRHSGSAAYLLAFEKKIIPELEIFQPQLLLLSAGFDAHKDDPTRGLRLNCGDFYTITQMLMGVARRCCGSKIVSVLEGGYDISPKTNALQQSVRNHLHALMNLEAPDGFGAPLAMTMPPSSPPITPTSVTSANANVMTFTPILTPGVISVPSIIAPIISPLPLPQSPTSQSQQQQQQLQQQQRTTTTSIKNNNDNDVKEQVTATAAAAAPVSSAEMKDESTGISLSHFSLESPTTSNKSSINFLL